MDTWKADRMNIEPIKDRNDPKVVIGHVLTTSDLAEIHAMYTDECSDGFAISLRAQPNFWETRYLNKTACQEASSFFAMLADMLPEASSSVVPFVKSP